MTTRGRRRYLSAGAVAALAGVVMSAVLMFAAGVAGASEPPSQNPGPSTAPPVGPEATPPTAHDLSDGVTTVPPTTTAKASNTVTKNATVRTTAHDSKRVWAVVAALILVALALSVLTAFYVRHTRPERPDQLRPPVLDGATSSATEPRPRGRSVPEPAGRP